jgi:hypothetical protein
MESGPDNNVGLTQAVNQVVEVRRIMLTVGIHLH